jgi:hypothetical protein
LVCLSLDASRSDRLSSLLACTFSGDRCSFASVLAFFVAFDCGEASFALFAFLSLKNWISGVIVILSSFSGSAASSTGTGLGGGFVKPSRKAINSGS